MPAARMDRAQRGFLAADGRAGDIVPRRGGGDGEGLSRGDTGEGRGVAFAGAGGDGSGFGTGDGGGLEGRRRGEGRVDGGSRREVESWDGGLGDQGVGLVVQGCLDRGGAASNHFFFDQRESVRTMSGRMDPFFPFLDCFWICD